MQHPVILRAALVVSSLLFAPLAGAGPVLPCPDGPDPLRFRPEQAVPGGAVSGLPSACAGPEAACPGPVAIAATVDPVTGSEWVAVAWRSPAEELMVAVSSNGGVGFGALPATLVDAGPFDGRPAVALRVDDGALRLGLAWCVDGANELRVSLTDVLDGSFGGVAVVAEPPLDLAAVLVIAPAPAAPIFAVAGFDSAAGEQVVATSAGSRDPADWSAPRTVLPSSRSRLALAADAAGAGGGVGLTLGVVDDSREAQALRSDDAGANWSAPTPLGDGSLSAWAPVLDSAPDPAAADAAWTVLAMHAQELAGPRAHLILGDAMRQAAGLLDHDFDASAGPASVVVDRPAEVQSLPAAAAAEDALAYLAWESGGELVVARRLLAAARPVLAGGCGAQRLTGLDPARAGGAASAPVAASLGRDLVLAFVDDRSGIPAVWIKRSDSEPPATPVLAPTPSACGEIPSIALAWDPPAADIVSQLLEVGTAPGGTDFTRDAGSGAAILVEGLAPGTAYSFRLRATDAAGHEVISEEVTIDTPACVDALLVATVVSITDSCPSGGAGGDGTLDPGETASLRVRVENLGTVVAPDVVLRLFSRVPELLVRTGNLDLGDLDVGAFAEGDVTVDLSASLPCGGVVEALARITSDGTRWSDLFDLSSPAACTPCSSPACSVTADASATAPVVICQGSSATLDAGATTSIDCAGVLLHEWFNGGNSIGTSGTETVSPNGTRTYRLVTRCSTDLDCRDEDTVEIVVNPRPGVSFSEDPPPPHCEGDTVTVTASTSDPGASFSWDTGDSTPEIQVSAGGLYRVTVTDTNGCVRGRTHRVDLGPLPLADVGPDSGITSCAPVRIGTPGFPLLDYSWDPPEGLDDPRAARPWASPAVATTYTLTVTDPLSGCAASDEVLVDVSPPPELVVELRLAKNPGGLAATWLTPATRPVRLYSESDETLARQASASSPSALRTCEGSGGCSFAEPAGALIFFQAVSVCEDGLSEGPN